MITCTALTILCVWNGALLADDDVPQIDDRFSRTIYAGAGAGISWLEPGTNKVDGVDLDERQSYGGQINVGVDLFRQLSLELHSADLGSAGLSPSGRINYHVDGISALVYAGKNRSRFKRTGLTAYGRSGFGVLSNSSVGNIPFRKLNAGHWLLGAGLEYNLPNGVGARAEVIAFDKDAHYGQIGMVYRFGQPRLNREQTQVDDTIDDQAALSSSTEPTSDSAPAASPTFPPPPPPPPPPPAKGRSESSKKSTDIPVECIEFSAGVNGIRFQTGSAQLSPAVKTMLDNVAITMAKCPQLLITVSAHTDSQGSDRTNQVLSQRRAWAVINYLRGIGINLGRMTPRAFGDTQPVDTNSTVEGRRNNRRVELIAR